MAQLASCIQEALMFNPEYHTHQREEARVTGIQTVSLGYRPCLQAKFPRNTNDLEQQQKALCSLHQ